MKKVLYRITALLLAVTLGCSFFGCTRQPEEPAPLVDGAYYTITSALSNRAMEASYFGLMEGNFVQQMDYEGDLNQIWRAVRQADGTYAFENMSTGRFLAVKKDSLKENAALCVKTREEDNISQSFRVEPANNGYNEYYIVAQRSGLTLELQDNKKSEGTKVVQNARSEAVGQLWIFTQVGDGTQKLPIAYTIQGSLQHSSCPEVVRYGDTYYCYIMGGGVSIKRSYDLKTWEYIGSAFPKPSHSNLPFGWQEEEIPNGDLVAPGVYKIGQQYCLYYAATTGGSQRSFITMATNTTLDPADPNYKWVDQGIVMSSYVGDPYNCIDPHVTFDKDGTPWLVFGSWWQGIFMRKLDINTGKLDESDTTAYNIASCATTGEAAIEAPWITYHDGYYYLFAAYGNMGRGSYYFGVTRSENLFGPYVDDQGRSAMEGYCVPVTHAQEGVENPGHASVFQDNDGQCYLVTEYFSGTSPSLLYIGTIEWDEKGWPYSALKTGIFD